jgi:hypothetical protein
MHRTIILPIILYGCETWSPALREEHRLRVFKNKVLRRIFGPGRDEVTGEWRRLHNKELHALYSSPNIIWVIKSRRMGWSGHVACMGERSGAYGIFTGENLKAGDHLEDPGIDGRITLIQIFEKWVGGIDWINLAQDRDRWQAFEYVVVNPLVPYNVGNFLTS